MFKFKETNKEANILKVKEQLEALVDTIEPLLSIEVGVNFNDASRAMDLSLYSTFKSREDLQTYATHEAHLKVVSLIQDVTVESKVVDYELAIK
jgi:hypothetical protein